MIRPHEGPQRVFLSTSADIAVYGGAAGGGKTWALLLDPLRHVHNPDFGAVIFRRTSPQITNEGGLWDESFRLYPMLGAKPFVSTTDWRFPSGANIGFRHLQYEADKLSWQGAQVPGLGFDELTHFTESQFFYLLSRNRSTCGVRPYVRATTNPDPGWVKTFLAPWVDRTYPDPAASGELRWFVRLDGKVHWVPAGTPDAKSVTFIRSSVFDNRTLLEKNPEYVATLRALPPVERARLLDGDWDVKREGLVYPGFSACVVPAFPIPEGTAVGGIDWGFHNPFAALSAVLDHDDVLWVHWERYGSRVTLTDHSKALPRNGIRWYADPAGADQIAEFRRADHDVIPAVHMGSRPLEDGIAKVTDRINSGRIKVSEVCRNLLNEANLHHYDKQTEKPVDADNHALAALRYLVVSIDRGRSVKDRQPDPTPEELAVLAEADKERQRQAEAEWHRIDNPAWWR